LIVDVEALIAGLMQIDVEVKAVCAGLVDDGAGGIVVRSASGRFLGIALKKPLSVVCISAALRGPMAGLTFVTTTRFSRVVFSTNSSPRVTATRSRRTRSGVAARMQVGDEDLGQSS
jgi:hypothetical protein